MAAILSWPQRVKKADWYRQYQTCAQDVYHLLNFKQQYTLNCFSYIPNMTWPNIISLYIKLWVQPHLNLSPRPTLMSLALQREPGAHFWHLMQTTLAPGHLQHSSLHLTAGGTEPDGVTQPNLKSYMWNIYSLRFSIESVRFIGWWVYAVL